jgi:glycosyltransferase involved in cell wall biosynthesis
MLDQITPLILTYNEAPNIERNLRQLTWARDIVLVDSFSTDETLTLARQFPQVRTFQRAFDSHQQQWSFGLQQTAIKTSWVLALDADYILTDELVQELDKLQPAPGVNGYEVSFIYCSQGKRLRSGVYPPATVLYRRERASYEQDGHTQRLRGAGKIQRLSSVILHDDRKPLTRWLNSQIRYCELEAQKLVTSESANLSFMDRMRRWVILAPVTMMFYCLFVRLGILDGWAGLHYAFERTVAESILSLYLIRHRLVTDTSKSENSGDQESESETASSNTQFKVQSTNS